jgi:hypothetical protein
MYWSFCDSTNKGHLGLCPYYFMSLSRDIIVSQFLAEKLTPGWVCLGLLGSS